MSLPLPAFPPFPLGCLQFLRQRKFSFPLATSLNELPAAEVLVLLDVVRLEPDAVEVVPQLALVALHPVNLNPNMFSSQMSVDYQNAS